MTSPQNIQILRLKRDDPLIDKVIPLFDELYACFKDLGHQLMPIAKGTTAWRESFEKTLNRYSILVIALNNDEITGFLHGFLKMLPAYLEGRCTGYISYTFVSPASRGLGIGKKMVASAREWFVEKNCSSIEVQALINNQEALQFWRRVGFQDESIQFRKFLTSPRSK